ncbi:hypothetical protein Poly30_38490 [Planctomycetes bacterium Poly30]|uniref:Uncharacterized protein n=1 Tax=Saltatorellus ferox TaxID=2528018 RepID=A0A518EW45_9BACT|nr:hypothetical protein Poly30_38490 [Planctomycetes bacterium Poly30]
MNDQHEPKRFQGRSPAPQNDRPGRISRIVIVLLAYFGFVVVGLAQMHSMGAWPFAAIAPGLSLQVWVDDLAASHDLWPNGAIGGALMCGLSALYYGSIYWSAGRTAGRRAYAPVVAIAVTTVLLVRYHMTLRM